MPQFREYDQFDALGLAEQVAKGEIRPEDLLETAMARAATAQVAFNALVRPLHEQARKTLAAELPNGPLRGVPYLLKDLLQPLAGARLGMGSRALEGYVADHDCALVSRLKQAGVVIFGQTCVPEFGLLAFTEPEVSGITRNPWDPTRTPGGSSGGSAAAVAAHIVPAAGANDGGGSIRIPAAYCGLFGLKPSRGRVSSAPDRSEVWMGASCDHALTRSVRDSAALLDAVAGTTAGDPFVIQPPEQPFLAALEQAPPRLRIGMSTRAPLGTAVDRECVAAVEDTARLLESLGHHVEQAEPEIDGQALFQAYLCMYFGEVAALRRDIIQLRGKGADRHFEPVTRALAAIGEAISAAEFVCWQQRWNDFGRSLGRFFKTYDLFLTPTTAGLPPHIGELQPKPYEQRILSLAAALHAGSLLRRFGMVEKVALENLSRTPFTQLANLSGVPAMSMPLYWTSQGLPIGVHFTAAFGAESLLFKLALELEQARPWFERRPVDLASGDSPVL